MTDDNTESIVDSGKIVNDTENRMRLSIHIDELVKKALDILYEKDEHLIFNQPLTEQDNSESGLGHHVGERAIVFRFAHYLQCLLSKDQLLSSYDLDCEYNRNGASVKSLESFPNGTYPDVIIHKRGSNDENLLVIEFKTYWNRNQYKDQKKITEFTSLEGKYRFLCGYTICIEKSREKCKIDKYPKTIVKTSMKGR